MSGRSTGGPYRPLPPPLVRPSLGARLAAWWRSWRLTSEGRRWLGITARNVACTAWVVWLSWGERRAWLHALGWIVAAINLACVVGAAVAAWRHRERVIPVDPASAALLLAPTPDTLFARMAYRAAAERDEETPAPGARRGR